MVRVRIPKKWRFVVYCLQHPETGEVVYVGQSTRGRGRGLEWLRGAEQKVVRRKYPQLAEWIRSLGWLTWQRRRRIVQILEILETPDLLDEREAHWIRSMALDGHRLFNKYHNPTWELLNGKRPRKFAKRPSA